MKALVFKLQSVFLTKSYLSTLVFGLSILSVFLFLGGWQMLFSEPTAIHFIRQTDTLSFIENYYLFGNNWWEPATFDLGSHEGKGASEFPLFYWFIAQFWKLGGEQIVVLRLWNLSIALCGMTFFFLWVKRELQSIFAAFSLSFALFSGLVFWYYFSNFLPDIAALGWMLSGWYFYSGDLNQRKNRVFALVFLSLAGLMKPTFLVLPMAYFIGLVLDNFISKAGWANFWIKTKNHFWLGIAVLGVCASWIIYVKWYNSKFGNVYFLFGSKPIWEMSGDDVSNMWNYISSKWFYRRYGSDQLWQVWLLSALIPLFFFKKIGTKWFFTLIFSFLGTFLYFILFYQQFKDHDYYFLCFIPVIGLWLFCMAKVVQQYKLGVFVLIYLFAISLAHIPNNRDKLKERMNDVQDSSQIIQTKLKGVNRVFIQNKIPVSATVIVVGSSNVNGALRLVERRGWSFPDWSEQSRQKISKCISFGATYLVDLTSENTLNQIKGKLLFQESNYKVFKLISKPD